MSLAVRDDAPSCSHNYFGRTIATTTTIVVVPMTSTHDTTSVLFHSLSFSHVCLSCLRICPFSVFSSCAHASAFAFSHVSFRMQCVAPYSHAQNLREFFSCGVWTRTHTHDTLGHIFHAFSAPLTLNA